MTRKDRVTDVNCDVCGKLISVQGEYIHQLNASFVSYKIGDDVHHVDSHLEPFMRFEADICKFTLRKEEGELKKLLRHENEIIRTGAKKELQRYLSMTPRQQEDYPN